MKPIEGNLFSPFQKKISKIKKIKGAGWDFTTELVWEKSDATVSKVRASDGFEVTTFRKLMEEVAYVTLNNPQFEMYYRGQNKDYKNNQGVFYQNRNPKTTIYPSICRPEKKADGTLKYSVRKAQIEKRYEELSKILELVDRRKSYFNEYYYALFQHYDILPTPFIDITQSLRVAATFALRNSSKGYVYVFGLPYPNQSISYFADHGIVLMKLQNMVPAAALRPRFQEGYLVGKFPILPNKTNGDDLANRLVAKFLVDDSNGNFWDQYFQPMPEDLIYPENDSIEKELIKLKQHFLSYKNL